MIALYNVADDVEGDGVEGHDADRALRLFDAQPYRDRRRQESGRELVQARYAVAIADSAAQSNTRRNGTRAASSEAGAAQLAASAKKSSERKTAPGLAREAVIAGEDARRAAMIGAAEAAAAAERQTAAAAAAEAERVRRAAENAAKLRDELRTRLNAALPTRESDRGLISEIGGVQFATGTANLSGRGARRARAVRGHRRLLPGLALQRRRTHG